MHLFCLSKRNELVKIMDIMENNKWTHGDLEDLLIEYRYNITEAKTFYLVSILCFFIIHYVYIVLSKEFHINIY